MASDRTGDPPRPAPLLTGVDLTPRPVRTEAGVPADWRSTLHPHTPIDMTALRSITGIDNTIEVLAFAEEVRDVFLDGVQASDVLAAPRLVRKGIDAYRGADRIPAELADLSAEEAEALTVAMADLLGPILGGIAARVGLASPTPA